MAALPFQPHVNYGTWSIDFEKNKDKSIPKEHKSGFHKSFGKRLCKKEFSLGFRSY